MMGLKTPSAENDFIRDMTARQRSFGLAIFPLDSYPNEEIIAYAAAEPDLFRITHLSRITVNSSEREARQVLESIQAGTKTVEEAAQTQSQDSYADRGGDMGIRMAYELAGDVPDSAEREAVIGTLPGAYSPVVKVPSGWAFFRAEEAALPVDTGDTANLAKIRSYMQSFQRGRMEDWLFAQARQLTGSLGEEGFDAAVERAGVQNHDFGPLPVNYGGLTMDFRGVNLFPTLSAQAVSELVPAESNENFWRAAFFTPLGTPSEPLVIGNNVLVVYPREEITKDAADTEEVDTFYSTWVSSNAEMSLRSHFITSKKLEDTFFATFLQSILQYN
jgi:hypothetical protein